ncbi:hypothetical protein SAMN04487830_12026 [Pseudobutyrivibrio sp. OR37]|uniref:hypothetical protein n=1 Tax=Pseudobutyrivibrio sp. OR37 TaxID=1798186 RepID=UPI0008DEB775|nr:hypothetical protein [Pseudobutyrivibrio sp. OR37]SFI06023.1 hypothetical protein SAMN04487830_12026 [Pseudobutyrivibrio sp. OR37]
MGFPILPFVLLFLIWLAIRIKTLDAKQEQEEAEFWAKEKAANATPAMDISNLRYITIPIEKFPLNFSNDEKVMEIESELIELSTHKLLNLSGISNTDLKLTYGVPNFETMTQIGEDFDKMCILLNSYSKILISSDKEEDAVKVLEFAIGVGTDISESYIMLANLYKKRSQQEKLGFLRERILNSNLLLKDSILNKIDNSTEENFYTSSPE